MLPSETMIWQPEFTDKTLSRKPGAVHLPEHQSSSSFTKKNNQLKQSGQSARTAYYFNGLLIFA
ncbi:hypothetical protein OU564_08030, partial [Escherichia coli]|nr:hypothetical protein [Escherichia coli]MDF8609606.1 hypothetical protein [Escherichia coli]